MKFLCFQFVHSPEPVWAMQCHSHGFRAFLGIQNLKVFHIIHRVLGSVNNQGYLVAIFLIQNSNGIKIVCLWNVFFVSSRRQTLVSGAYLGNLRFALTLGVTRGRFLPGLFFLQQEQLVRIGDVKPFLWGGLGGIHKNNKWG